jgi:hypothetical protein
MNAKIKIEENDDSKEYMVSLIHKNAVITVYMDALDGEFVPVVRLPNENKDRGYVDKFATIAKAVKFARGKIDEIL